MHKFFHVFYLAIILALLWFGNFSSEHPSSIEQAAQSFEEGFAEGFASAKNAATEGNVESDAVERTSALVETTNRSADEVVALAPEPQQEDKIAAQLREFTTYPDRMLQESVDPDWAYLVESDVARLFDTKDMLGDLPLQSVTCRTSICELKVGNESGMRIEDLIRVQKILADQPWYSEDYTSQFNIKNEDDHHSVFIVRPQP